MPRKKTEQRRLFSVDEKIFILDKSNNKCCRCGKTIDINSMTVEHVIPLSKGGKNERKNLIALCEDCNIKKTNYILHPSDYYEYLNEFYMNEVMEIYKEYMKDIPWYGVHNFTKEDVRSFEYRIPMMSHVKKTKKGYILPYMKQNLLLKKTYRNEYKDIYKYIKEYNEKYGFDTDYLEDVINETYKKGCIYKLYKNNEIVALLPLKIDKVNYFDDEKTFYTMCLNGILCKYQKKEYLEPITNAILYIMRCMSELNHVGAASIDIMIPENDLFLQTLMSNKYLNAHKCYTDTNNWINYNISYIVGKGNTSQEKEFEYNETLKMDSEKITKIYSDGLQRCLNLPDLNRNKEHEEKVQNIKDEITNKKNKKKRIKNYYNEIDEYDLKYYL